jgi:tetratricopeptide (TPR) repeat protein
MQQSGVGSPIQLPRALAGALLFLLASAAAAAQSAGPSDACLGWGDAPPPPVDACLDAAEPLLGVPGVDGRRARIALRTQARRLGGTERGAALWERSLALDPRDAESNLEVARLRADAGRYAEAEELAVKAAKYGQARNNVWVIKEARTLLAGVELRRGDGDAASELFRSGVGEWDGTHPSDGTHYGCAYQAFGELYGALAAGAGDGATQGHAAAVDAFVTGRTDHLPGWADAPGDDAERWSLRALLLLHERAYDRVDGLLAAPPVGVTASEVAVVEAHLAIVRHDFVGALAAADEAARGVPPGDPARARLLARSVDLAHGWARSNRDEHPAAVGAFGRLVAREPDDLLGLVGLGNSLLALERLDEAEAAFDAVLARDPDNRFALAERAMVHFVRGQDERAEAGFLAAMERAANTYTCPYEGLGLLYMRQGRAGEAERLFERAIEINPTIEYRKYDELARIRIAAGDLRGAEALLKQSLSNHPDGPDAKAMLAEVEGLLGQR